MLSEKVIEEAVEAVRVATLTNLHGGPSRVIIYQETHTDRPVTGLSMNSTAPLLGWLKWSQARLQFNDHDRVAVYDRCYDMVKRQLFARGYTQSDITTCIERSELDAWTVAPCVLTLRAAAQLATSTGRSGSARSAARSGS